MKDKGIIKEDSSQKRKGWLFLQFIWLALKTPLSFLRQINRTNIKILLKALKRESPYRILTNFKILLIQGRSIKRGSINISETGEELVFEKKNPYQVWIKNNTLSDGLIRRLREVEAAWSFRPTISIIIPVYNTKKEWLEKAIKSVQNQIYSNWELCLADDASTVPYIKPYLKSLEAEFPNIKVVFRSENGNISEAINSANNLATGDYLAFLDQDDELAINALFEIVRLLQKNREVDIFYSDEDKIDESGKRYDPSFKPDWSPELLLSHNYFNHLFCLRRSIFNTVGRMRNEFDGCQDYDLVLRAIAHSDQIIHIPKVLYHWRAVEGVIGLEENAKSSSFSLFEQCRKVIQLHLDVQGISASVIHPAIAKEHALGLYHLKWPHNGQLVTIIIPSKNHYNTLKRCIDSLSLTQYQNYEVLVIDNDSDDPRTLKYLKKLKNQPGISVKKIKNKGTNFSYAYINNEAVKWVKGSLILFLNDDTEVIAPEWLSQLVGYQSLNGVGITGAKLLYPEDDSTQHGGILNGIYVGQYSNLCDHAFRNFPEDKLGHGSYTHVACNYSGVTAACLLVSKKDFLELDGFDENHFALAYNDVDLCLKMFQSGQRIVFVPNALLYHHESKSRKDTFHLNEMVDFKAKYRTFKDPYYNPNLSLIQQFEIDPANTFGYKIPEDDLPRLLAISPNLNLEGVSIQQYEVLEGIIQRGSFQIEVGSTKDGPLRKWYEALGVKVHIFTDPVSKHLIEKTDFELDLSDFTNWLRTGRFDVVYVNTLVPFFVHEACQQLNIPSIWNIHKSVSFLHFFDYLPFQIRKKAFESFELPYYTIFASKSTAKLYEAVNTQQTHTVINYGLKPDKIHTYIRQTSKMEALKLLGFPLDKLVFLNHGSVCQRKGQLDFVKAAISCLKKGITNHYYVLFRAKADEEAREYWQKIIDLIQSHKMEEHFHIEPETEDVFTFFRAADVFVCSSYNESYPRVILKAMLFGLPIITTPVFGIKEQVLENVNAHFFVPGDVTDLAHKMKNLGSAPLSRNKLGKNSINVFTLINTYEEMVSSYEKLFQGAYLAKYKAYLPPTGSRKSKDEVAKGLLTQKNEMKGRKCIIILGMHRSGTSALAGTLYQMGVHFGWAMLPPDSANIKGYYENERVMHINDALLRQFGHRWDSPFLLPDEWWKLPDLEAIRERIACFATEELFLKPIVGIKDPRLCLLLPIWEEILKQLGIEPYYILMLRSPAEIASSLKKRNKLKSNHAAILWMNHILHAEKFTRNKARVVITFEQLVQNTEQCLQDIFRVFQLKVPSELKVGVDFVDPVYKTQNLKDKEFFNTLSPYFNAFYNALLPLTKGEEANYANLDRIAAMHTKTRSNLHQEKKSPLYTEKDQWKIWKKIIFQKMLVHSEVLRLTKGFLEVRGWAVSYDGVGQIELFYKEQSIGKVECHIERPDLEEAYPNYKNSRYSGFFYFKPFHQSKNEESILFIDIRVTSKSGIVNSYKKQLLNEDIK